MFTSQLISWLAFLLVFNFFIFITHTFLFSYKFCPVRIYLHLWFKQLSCNDNNYIYGAFCYELRVDTIFWRIPVGR